MIMRREFVLGAAAAGVLMQPRFGFAKASQPATNVNFDVPEGACDCHTHIHGDPAKFPWFAGRTYTPELALPEEMRARVDHFFRTHQAWLTKLLKRGAARGEFALVAPPAKVARSIFASLQGALLVKRATGDISQINDVIAVMKLQLAGRS